MTTIQKTMIQTTPPEPMMPATPLSADSLERYRAEGYLVVPALLSEKEVAHFLDYQSRPQPAERQKGLLTHTVDPEWEYLAKHPRVTGAVRQLLGGRPMIVQTMFLNKPPGGGKGLALHQDLYYIDNEPNTLMACWIALTDTDAENGGLCVVPGSHRAGLLRSHKHEKLEEHAAWESQHTLRDRNGREWTRQIVSAEVDALDPDAMKVLSVPRGAGVFFSSTLIHGSYANRSNDRPRPAFAIHYVRKGTWVYRTDIQNVTPAQNND